MKKHNPDEKIPGAGGRLGSNESSMAYRGRDQKEGMSVPSSQRGGSNKGGTNDKGSGENPSKIDTRRMGTNQQSDIQPKGIKDRADQKGDEKALKDIRGTGENPKQTNRPR